MCISYWMICKFDILFEFEVPSCTAWYTCIHGMHFDAFQKMMWHRILDEISIAKKLSKDRDYQDVWRDHQKSARRQQNVRLYDMNSSTFYLASKHWPKHVHFQHLFDNVLDESLSLSKLTHFLLEKTFLHFFFSTKPGSNMTRKLESTGWLLQGSQFRQPAFGWMLKLHKYAFDLRITFYLQKPRMMMIEKL